MARLAAQRGYAVAINYRKKRSAAEALVEELRQLDRPAIAVQADVAEASHVEGLYARVKAELGAPTAVVNSAGIAPGPLRVADATVATLEELWRTNVLGVMLSCREAARAMCISRGGAGGVVINVSSMAATIGGRAGNSHYAASKAAVDSFSVGFAKEVAADGVRVISVRPGFTATDMTRARLQDPAVDKSSPRPSRSADLRASTRSPAPSSGSCRMRRRSLQEPVSTSPAGVYGGGSSAAALNLMVREAESSAKSRPAATWRYWSYPPRSKTSIGGPVSTRSEHYLHPRMPP